MLVVEFPSVAQNAFFPKSVLMPNPGKDLGILQDSQVHVSSTLSNTTLQKIKFNRQGEYLLTRLHHKVLWEVNGKIPVQFDLNRDITGQFQKHFMMQPSQGVFSIFIQLFFLECRKPQIAYLRLTISVLRYQQTFWRQQLFSCSMSLCCLIFYTALTPGLKFCLSSKSPVTIKLS